MSRYSGLKVLWHDKKMKALLEGRVSSPIHVRVKPTNKCLHHCYYCMFDPKVRKVINGRFSRHDEIPKAKMREILDDFRDIGVRAVTYSGGGDPLAYSHIEEALERTLENGLDLAAITNGQLLRGKTARLLRNAKWVRVSAESINADIFLKIRRVSEAFFYELIENIRSFAESKSSSCELGINFVVNEHNAGKVYDSVEFFRNLGANHIKITPVSVEGAFLEYHRPTKDRVIGQIASARRDFAKQGFEIYDTYENDFNLTGVDSRTYSKCCAMQILSVIAADSVVYTCHDKPYTQSGEIGSLKNQSFRQMWFSHETAEKFRRFNPQQECCHYCTQDAKNVELNRILEMIKLGEKTLEEVRTGPPPENINFV